jgi:hypothetical protein
VSRTCTKMKERRNDVEWQNMFANIREKMSLVILLWYETGVG